jgi:hypothetical protein
MLPVLIDTPDIPVTDAPAILRIVPVDDHLMPVIAVQPIPRSDPDKLGTILEDGFDRTVG